MSAADEAGRPLLTPANAYSEALVAFARAGRVAEAREAIAAMGITVESLNATMAEHAAELCAIHQHLRMPDAMVLACARDLGGALLSYDKNLLRLANKK